MRQEDRRTGAISLGGVGIPVLLWVLGELKVHPPRIVLYLLLVLSVVLIVVPWLVIWRHRRHAPPATQRESTAVEPPAAQATAGPRNASWNALLRRAFHEHKGRRSVIEALSPAERERILRESGEPYPALTPDCRKWLEKQYARGKDERDKVGIVRGEVLAVFGVPSVLSPSFNLTALTNTARRWGSGLADGLRNAGFTDAAAEVAGSPPAAEGHPTTTDCDLLTAYIETRMRVIQDLLRSGS